MKMTEREPDLGRTLTWLARDVRPMSGPVLQSRTLKPVSSSAFNVRLNGPDLGRTWAARGSPGPGPGHTPATPAEPIGPDIAGRTLKTNHKERTGDCKK
jgi:hypothetical protein